MTPSIFHAYHTYIITVFTIDGWNAKRHNEKKKERLLRWKATYGISLPPFDTGNGLGRCQPRAIKCNNKITSIPEMGY